jgi:cell division protease FtsH
VLDPALLRPGRFDRRIVVNRPDVKGREGILIVHTKKIPLSDDVDIRVLARGTSGFCGADLANLVNEAALSAARYNQKVVRMSDFEYAKDKVLMGTERRSMVITEEEKKITAIHEAGHALLAVVLPHADPIHKVTIIPRGMAMGVTMQLPLEERYLMSKSDLENQVAVLLGGRSAESLTFGEVSTGAQNDLMRATDIARSMVTEYGMSEIIGPVHHEGQRRSPFLEPGFAPERGAYAEETARAIDAEVRRIISAAEARARQILEERRDILLRLSERLLEKEVIEGDELRELVGPLAPPPDAVS